MHSTERFAHVPAPPGERSAWILAGALCAAGIAVLVAVLVGAVGRTSSVAPPPVLVTAQTPVPSAQASAAALAGTRQANAGNRSAGALAAGAGGAHGEARVARQWMEGFYPIYARAQRAFGVSWLLLASIHM